jgi:hypothetical protein
MNKKKDMGVIGLVVIAVLGVFLFQNVDLTGEASRNVQTNIELADNEYLFHLNERKLIGDVPITLMEVTESDEVIVNVDGEIKSVNEFEGRVINGIQIESRVASETGAILRVTNLVKLETTCVDTDLGDIYSRGKCDDRFYPEGVEDFCDFNTLKEYNCGYDVYVDEVHCLKHEVECSDGCSAGACRSG